MTRILMAAILGIAVSAPAASAQSKVDDAEGRGNGDGNSRGTGQPEHRNRRAARHHSRCRAEDGGTHHRLPAEEWWFQEGRRPDERQRRRGKEFPQDEAAHHDYRAESRSVADVSGRGGALRRPRPARAERRRLHADRTAVRGRHPRGARCRSDPPTHSRRRTEPHARGGPLSSRAGSRSLVRRQSHDPRMSRCYSRPPTNVHRGHIRRR